MEKEIDEITAVIINEAIVIHRALGPGLLESVYETVLAGALKRIGLKVDRQKPVDIEYDGMIFAAAFKMDLLVEDRVVLEIKSLEQLSKVHGKQLLTYLRLTGQPVGLLLNFSGATMKEGIKRIVTTIGSRRRPPRLRVSA